MYKYLFAFLFLTQLGLVFSQGEEWRVTVGVNGTFTNIQDALEEYRSLANETISSLFIQLERGVTFFGSENVDLDLSSFGDLKLTIEGESAEERTVIDCESAGTRFFYIMNPLSKTNNSIVFEVRNLEIQNCYASNTTNTTVDGGAILMHTNSSDVTLRVDNCIFRNNRAGLPDGWGGAIYVQGPNPNQVGLIDHPYLEIRNCVFINNTSPFEGGAIRITDGDGSITGTQFINNTSINREGGAIYLLRSIVDNIHDSSFVGNRAINGGAISFLNSVVTSSTSTSFYGNIATAHGGSFRLNVGSAFACSDCIFNDNRANGNGGAGFLTSGEFVGNNCTIQNNFANAYGTLFAQGTGSIRLTKSRVTNNRVNTGGGGLAILSNGRLVINETLISNNNAFFGGAIYIQYNARINIIGSNIESNIASSQGGAIYCSDSYINILSTSISNNIANQDPIIHCSTIVAATFCSISGDPQYAGLCAEPKVEDNLTSTEITLIVIGAIVGAVIIGLCVLLVVYFSNPENRRKKAGWLFQLIDGDDNKNEQQLDEH